MSRSMLLMIYAGRLPMTLVGFFVPSAIDLDQLHVMMMAFLGHQEALRQIRQRGHRMLGTAQYEDAVKQGIVNHVFPNSAVN